MFNEKIEVDDSCNWNFYTNIKGTDNSGKNFCISLNFNELNKFIEELKPVHERLKKNKEYRESQMM